MVDLAVLVELSHKLHKANITKVVNVIHNLGKKKKEQDKVAHELGKKKKE